MTTPILYQPSAFKTYYLGFPGSMQLIRTPNAAIPVPTSRGEVVHDLISGGTAVTHRLDARRGWQLGFAGCTPDTADLILGFYLGVFGEGPYAFVDPAWRNALNAQASTFGALQDVNTEWTASAGTLAFDTAIAAPFPTSGVTKWTGAQVNSQLSIGTWNGTVFAPDSIATPPYLGQVQSSVLMYARAVTGTPSVTLRGRVDDATGANVSSATGTTATLSTSAWTPLTATVAASIAGGVYERPNLLCNTANSIIRVAAAAVQYGKATPDGWVIGLGIPRVIIPAEFGGQYELLYARDHTLTLVEA